MSSGLPARDLPPVPDLIRRQTALAKALAEYRGVSFKWDAANCATLLRSHLLAMGHDDVPEMPEFKSALGAKRALAAMGYDSVTGLLDSLLIRIPASRALLADVVLMGGPEDSISGIDAITLATGGGKIAGWHEDAPGLVVMDPVAIIGAWRA